MEKNNNWNIMKKEIPKLRNIIFNEPKMKINLKNLMEKDNNIWKKMMNNNLKMLKKKNNNIGKKMEKNNKWTKMGDEGEMEED